MKKDICDTGRSFSTAVENPSFYTNYRNVPCNMYRIVLSRLVFLALAILSTSACTSRKIITDSSRTKDVPMKGSVIERYSALLDVREKDLKNERLYRFIDNWVGVPHKLGGMDRKGVDCSGFITILNREIYGQDLPRTALSMANMVKRKYESELEEGDLVFFDFNGQKFSHVGVYLHNNKFVHTSTSRGVIISDLKDPWYYKYFSRGGTVK